jgi:hypothetical protein
MIRGLKNTSLAGRDKWPKNVTKACNCLSKWEGDDAGGGADRECKVVRKASDVVQSGGLAPIPAAIVDHCRKITLCVDVMKVNKMPFLVSISRAVKFGTVA